MSGAQRVPHTPLDRVGAWPSSTVCAAKVREMKVTADLLGAWKSDPEAQLSVIVHVSGPPVQYVDALKAHGVSVARVFRLTSTVAATGPTCRMLDLLEEPWVDKIEPDRRVTTMI